MKRSRLTISINNNILDRVDNIIDGINIRNRSHAIETLLSEALNISTIKTAVILAGGKDAEKRIPAIKSALEMARKNGIFDVIIALGYLGAKVKESIGNDQDSGLKIEYVEGGQGTGGALLLMKNKLRSTFVVFNLQSPVECDLKNLIKFHNERKPCTTIATKSLKELWGIYIMDPKIFSYIPKGFSMLEDEIFDNLIKDEQLLSYPMLN